MGEERNGIIVNMNKEKDKKVYVDIITKSQ
jgi:hypothetical protein